MVINDQHKICSGHRTRMRRTGSYGTTPIKRVPPPGTGPEGILIFNGWDITETGCWEYRGPKFANGYGQVKVNGAPQLAHRLAYVLWVGDIPERLVIRHTCDNKPCINPEHLIPGTSQDNSNDAKERNRAAVGERHPNAKLRDQDAIDIRAYLALAANRIERGRMYYELADKYGVSYSCIQAVWLRITFKHL